MDWYEFLVQQIFTRRNFASDGSVALLQQADFDYHLDSALGGGKLTEEYGEALRCITSRSNTLALETLERLLDAISTHGIDLLLEEQEMLVALADREWRGEMPTEVELRKLTNEEAYK